MALNALSVHLKLCGQVDLRQFVARPDVASRLLTFDAAIFARLGERLFVVKSA